MGPEDRVARLLAALDRLPRGARRALTVAIPVALLGALAAFVSAVSYAVSAISVRVLTKTDSNTSVVFWSMAIMTVISTLLALRDWESIRVEHIGWIAATGAVGALAVHMLTQAFRSAPASAIAPFEYTALLWGVGIDWLVWDTLPDSRVYLGGSIVIASPERGAAIQPGLLRFAGNDAIGRS